MPPEALGLMCHLAEVPGREALELLALSVIENPKNHLMAEVLREAFFEVKANGEAQSQRRPSIAETVVCSIDMEPSLHKTHCLLSDLVRATLNNVRTWRPIAVITGVKAVSTWRGFGIYNLSFG